MEDELISFRWAIPDQGYRWEMATKITSPAGGVAEPYLVSNATTAKGRWSTPLSEEPIKDALPLFVEFGALDGSQDSILAFAHTHGWLGAAPELIRDASGRGLQGEALSNWRREIEAMRGAVQIWQALYAPDQKALKTIVQWDSKHETITVHTQNRIELLAAKDHRPTIYEYLVSSGTLVHKWGAGAALMVLVNQHLEGGVSPLLRFTDHRRHIGAELRPKSLLHAMWLQLHQAVTGERRIHRCSHCHKWMEIPAGSRSTKSMHPRCVLNKKMSLYRKRQRQAQELAARNVSVHQIAKKLKTTLAIARKWIKQ